MALNREKAHQTAQRLVLKGQIDKAIAELRPILEEDPNDTRTLQKVADLYRRKGSYQEAEAVYTRLADVLLRSGFYQRAVAVHHQILQLNPTNLPVHIVLGDTLTKLGLVQEASKIFARTVGLLDRAGRFEEATAILEKLIAASPDNYQARLQLAELYLKAGRTGAAVQAFEEALPTLRAQGRDDLFQRAAERLLYYQPDNLALCRELAVFHLRRQNVPQGMRLLQYCHKKDPNDVETLRLLADHFGGTGDTRKAVVVLHQMARVFSNRGDRAAAADVWRKILEMDPDNTEAREALGLPPASTPRRAPGAPPRRLPPPPARPPGALAAAGPVEPGEPVEEVESVESVVPEDFEEVVSAEAGVPAEDTGAGGTPEGVAAARVPADRPRTPAGAGGRVLAPLPEEGSDIQKIAAEADIFLKFGLKDRAIGHLTGAIAQFPRSVVLRERLAAIYLNEDNLAAGIRLMLESARILAPVHPEHALRILREVQFLDEGNAVARELIAALERGAAAPAGEAAEAGPERTTREAARTSGLPEDLDVDVEVAEEPVRTVVVPPLEPSSMPPAKQRSPAEPASVSARPEVGSPHVPGPPPVAAAPPPALFDLSPPPGPPAAVAPSPAGGRPEKATVVDLPSFDAVETGPPFLEAAGLFAGAERLAVPLSEQAAAPLVLEMSDEEFADDLAKAAPLVDEFEAAGPTPSTLERDEPDEMELVTTEELPAPAASAPSSAVDAAITQGLEEVEFFRQQGLEDDARTLLEGLAADYPQDARIAAKLAELRRAPTVPETASSSAGPARLAEPSDGLEALESALDALTSGASGPHPSPDRPPEAVAKLPPSAATMHYDLGVAYREMGVLDRAIDEFRLAAKDPSREANCRALIGGCLLGLGKAHEAIEEYKRGLHVRGRTEADELELYYGLADAHLSLGEGNEALFYLQSIKRRDPAFRDVARKLAALQTATRPGRRPGVRSEPPPAEVAGDDGKIDEAFDDFFKNGRG